MFRCNQCQAVTPKWIGRCPQCHSWNTFEEEIEISNKGKSFQSSQEQKGATPQKLIGIVGEEIGIRTPFLSAELNTVLGGGLVPGSFILLSGEPGIGKSTLSLQMADWYAQEGREVLYISGEENVGQIAGRAARLGIKNPNISLLGEYRFEKILQILESTSSNLIILDSISVFSSETLEATAGSIPLLRAIAEMLMQLSKRTKKSLIIIGHVTKDGSISGPKTLEHLVDTVLFLEGSKHESYRMLRGLKNRFGSTDELGIFKMTEAGLQDVRNPGSEFMQNSKKLSIGAAYGMTLEGSRPLVFEIESLITPSKFGYPKRSARGFPGTKLDIILAVLSKYTKAKFDEHDVYLNIAYGLQLQEPGADFAAIASLLSGKMNLSLTGYICIGEISLTGKIKTVAGMQKRIEEAKKLGFHHILCGTMENPISGILSFENICEVEKYFLQLSRSKDSTEDAT